MTVTFGLFNIITAIYIENTMSAAKSNDEKNKQARERESLRVAHLAKRLLRNFCIAQRIAESHRGTNEDLRQSIHKELRHSKSVDFEDLNANMEDISISRDLYLVIIQNQDIQNTLDELDIPPDRAHLFDVLDADGSGDLHLEELVLGLLKVRGEARRSDNVEMLLAIKSLHETLRSIVDTTERLRDHLGVPEVETLRKTGRNRSFSGKF
jgi:hypothetical protein